MSTRVHQPSRSHRRPAHDALLGSRTIRASGTTRREIDRILGPLPDLANSGMRAWEVQRASSWKVGVVLTGIRVAVLFVAGVSLAQNRISPGDLVASALYLTLALGFVSEADSLLRIGDAWANAGRVLELLDDEPQSRPCHAGPRARPASARPGASSFRGVITASWRSGRARCGRPRAPGRCGPCRRGAIRRRQDQPGLLVGRLLEPDEGEVLIDGISRGTLDTQFCVARSPMPSIAQCCSGQPCATRDLRESGCCAVRARARSSDHAGRRFHQAVARWVRHDAHTRSLLRRRVAAPRAGQSRHPRRSRPGVGRRDLEPRHGNRGQGGRCPHSGTCGATRLVVAHER